MFAKKLIITLISVVYVNSFSTTTSFKHSLLRNHFSLDNAKKNSYGSVIKQTLVSMCTAIVLINPIAASANEAQFINALTGILETKAVMKPVKDYVANQQYDPARTNIKYCINQLQFSKKVEGLVQNSVDYVDDADLLDRITEAAGKVVNTAIQLDSTVYTMIFIPSEGGEIPDSAKKYQKQSVDFYDSLNSDLDLLLKAAGEAQLKAASAKAEEDLKTFPKFLFKDAKPPSIITY